MNSASRQRMIDAEPPMTEVSVTDAYIGAVGEHLGAAMGSHRSAVER